MKLHLIDPKKLELSDKSEVLSITRLDTKDEALRLLVLSKKDDKIIIHQCYENGQKEKLHSSSFDVKIKAQFLKLCKKWGFFVFSPMEAFYFSSYEDIATANESKAGLEKNGFRCSSVILLESEIII